MCLRERDTPPEEVIASDQKRLIVDAFARFQIVDPLKFYISVGNERVARSRLSTIINSRIRNVLGQQELQTLLSKDRTKQMTLIQEGVNNEAENFGIKIVDVRIKRADLPQANSEAIYRRMQTEREREAKEFRARGAEMAVTITSTADKEVTVILADAQKKSEIMKGEGDGQRNKIFADAFGRDPEFFGFYRAMQAYEKALIGGETSLILSPDSEFFKFFGNTKPKTNQSKFIMKELIIAFGLFLFLEGILYAIFPSKMKNMLKKLNEVSDNQLRYGGLTFAIIGFLLIWYMKQ